MEAPGVTLTDDEVRARFSDYREGALPAGELAFVRARLETDPVLAAEYARFEQLLAKLAGMGFDEEHPVEKNRVDLLAGVQSRLKVRSRGRFYGSWAERLAGVVPLEWILGTLLLLLVLAYAASVVVQVER